MNQGVYTVAHHHPICSLQDRTEDRLLVLGAKLDASGGKEIANLDSNKGSGRSTGEEERGSEPLNDFALLTCGS